ncbi:hypothetical protein AJ79_00396 [Helicocarpus griseus UAMH5409]|uniref:Phosphodiesterase n=1 Tax=Helicocarpus griseus UAMH5409 TaxID=1447875 RepID=A0A2B7YDD6_9EURO|nr:hypothetical protein AJ79_00396 [Helicocarpus griseus UAMH5409]
MEPGESCAVYLDERVKEERWVVRNTNTAFKTSFTGLETSTLEESELHSNVRLFLGVFKKVFLSKSRISFASQLAELNQSCRPNSNPIFALVAVGVGAPAASETLRQSSGLLSVAQSSFSTSCNAESGQCLHFSAESDEFCVVDLLSAFSANMNLGDEPSLAVPIAVLRFEQSNVPDRNPDGSGAKGEEATSEGANDIFSLNSCVARCLDAGAVDVLTTPLDPLRIQSLSVLGYRTHKAAQKAQSKLRAGRRIRKQSWVGTNDQQPYAYLREAMVSKLMKRICSPEEEIEDFRIRDLRIPQDRKRCVEVEIGKWDFSAHGFSDDELLYAASMMLQHALKMPELESWRLSSDDLHAFLLATRAAYNSFVLYHNFRHAVDVLQSTFHFLVSIGVLPRYPAGTKQCPSRSPIASLLTPFDALTLLVTAIGHDVGHPGVNNVFLVKLNAPLAQLYNDNSVLESFHCAAYSQILRAHWPVVFADVKLRKLMISSILATDMGVHHKFMESLRELQGKYHETHTTDGWDDQYIDTNRALLCGLLIKCADISNVARPWSIAERWTNILQEEFAHQGDMEKDIGMETALFGGPPELGNLPKLGQGQIGFMNIFALPLFEGVADIIPEMAFAAAEVRRNKSVWQELVNPEERRETSGEPLPEGHIPAPSSQSPDHRSPPPDLKIPVEKLSVDSGRINPERTPPATWTVPPTLSQIQLNKEMRRGIDESLEDYREALIDSPDVSPLTISTGGLGHDDAAADENQPSAGSRRFQCHRPFQRSSGRASTITPSNRHSEGTSGTRTQSTSTYTNNTVMTPISSTTQASSFVSVGSSNDGHGCTGPESDRNPESRLPSSYSESLADQDVGGSSRATPVAMSTGSDRPHQLHPYHNSVDDKNAPQFMTALIDKSFGHTQSNGFSITSPTSSTSVNNCHPTTSSHSSNPESPPSHSTSNNNNNSNRTVPRRRSRLRLAFWRRNRQSPVNATDDV